MRIRRTKSTGVARGMLTAAAVSAAATGFSLLSAGTASASTVLPEEAQNSCSSAVHGVMGDTVAITGQSVEDIVKKGANEAKKIPLISDASIWETHLSRVIADAGTIPVGTVPQADTATVSGEKIAAEVVERIEGEPGLGVDPKKTLGVIKDTVAKKCDLTVFASNYSESADSTDSPAQQGQAGGESTGGGPTGGSTANGSDLKGVPGTSAYGTGDARAPRRDYSGIPAVPAPSAGISVPPDLRYAPEASLPQQAPGFDILGKGNQGTQSGKAANPSVRDAGNADALAAPASPDRVQLPMLLAVVALAVVTAALVRTWVLRRLT